MKESWKAISELLNKRSKSSNIDCLKESGSEILHKIDISNAMNSFFCSVGKGLADKIEPAPNPLLAGNYEISKHIHISYSYSYLIVFTQNPFSIRKKVIEIKITIHNILYKFENC